MKTISSQVFRLLKPGGRFIFSVPHPFMLNAHGDESGDSTFSFAKGGASSDKYFSLRGRKFSGVIKRVDGCPLNVKMDFKTISDYVETLRECGFEIGNIHEARVLPEHVSEHPTFFNSVKDSPLHLVFDVSKPKASKSLDGVQYPPKQIIWSNFQKKHASKILNMRLPDEAVQELRSLVYELVNKGITVDTFDHHDTYMKKLPNVAVFATYVRKQLVHTVGAALVNGLDLESYKAEGESSDEFCHIRAKLAYYILCSLIGKVDGSSRGRQFEVKNTGNSTKADNVLFSVSDDEAPWHTDGASVDKVYNVASLLCITQADEGGAFHLSNACNAFHELKKKLPKFLLYELTRALPRHVLEKGHGQGIRKGSIGINLRRSNTLMEDRVRYNSYPIFQEEEGNRLRIRYMRYWIETGHEKAGLAVSPLLRLAMDALDSALQKEEVFNQRLTPGQMVFCNNELFVHSRDHFVDSPSSPPRLMIRTWINVDGLED